jgi:glycosyltransferase involved in cell wall biosynthesis
LLSVIIPARDVGPFIEAAVGSALGQTLRDLEVLVVDDGSRDDTWERLGKFQDSRLRLLKGEGRGGPAARNQALALARGRYVAFLDADDVWRPQHLERLSALLDQEPEVDLAFSAVAWIDEDGVPLPRSVVRRSGRLGYAELFLEFYPVTTSALCVRREAALRVGGFDETLRTGTDHDLCLRIACLRPSNCAGVPDIGLDYRRRQGQITANRKRKAQGWEDLLRKHRAIAPDAVTRLEASARANHQRALCALAYEAGEFAEARAWLAKALLAAPWPLARDRRTWIALAAAASSLLPHSLRRVAEKVGAKVLQGP